MAVFRIEKTRDYTVMSNHHLRNAGLSLKSKGLLSMMLSLPEDWNYTTRGLAKICKEGTDSIGSALKELERAGYIVRNRLRDSKGKIVDVEYVIYETPHPPDTGQPCEDKPDTACPDTENPDMDNPCLENRPQLNKEKRNPEKQNTDSPSTEGSNPIQSSPQTPAGAKQTGRDWMRERESYRELILENIEYDILIQNERMDRDRLDELVELMVDKSPGKPHTNPLSRPIQEAGAAIHGKVREVEQENSGVQSGHLGERSFEKAVGYGNRRVQNWRAERKLKPWRDAAKAEQAAGKSNADFYYRKAVAENPQLASNPISRLWQKRKLQKQYAAAYRAAGKTAQAGKTAEATAKAAKKTAQESKRTALFLKRHWKGALIVGGIGLLLVMLLGSLQSCSSMFGGGVSNIMASSYLSEDSDMLAAEEAYCAKEDELREYPFDDPVGLVMNDEGKLIGLDLNRSLRDEHGEIYDIVAGTFLVVGLGPESFAPLPPDMIQKYTEQFKRPELFSSINGQIVSVPVKPENPLRTVEMTLEDDYGMIDGIINNGRRGEELEKAQAEVRRTTPEKKPSIRERLEDAKRECGSRKGPDKPALQKKPSELGDL